MANAPSIRNSSTGVVLTVAGLGLRIGWNGFDASGFAGEIRHQLLVRRIDIAQLVLEFLK
jgi:hypothetical protein